LGAAKRGDYNLVSNAYATKLPHKKLGESTLFDLAQDISAPNRHATKYGEASA
jgi:hypothetical protein